jgi:hypothetical protein
MTVRLGPTKRGSLCLSVAFYSCKKLSVWKEWQRRSRKCRYLRKTKRQNADHITRWRWIRKCMGIMMDWACRYKWYYIYRVGRGSNLSGVRFSAPVQIDPGAHPASYTMGAGFFQGVKQPGRDVKHPPYLAPRWRKKHSCTSTPPLGLRGLL